MRITICPICAVNIHDDDDPSCMLICGHIFHGRCAQVALAKSSTCPRCQTPHESRAQPIHLSSVTIISSEELEQALSLVETLKPRCKLVDIKIEELVQAKQDLDQARQEAALMKACLARDQVWIKRDRATTAMELAAASSEAARLQSATSRLEKRLARIEGFDVAVAATMMVRVKAGLVSLDVCLPQDAPTSWLKTLVEEQLGYETSSMSNEEVPVVISDATTLRSCGIRDGSFLSVLER